MHNSQLFLIEKIWAEAVSASWWRCFLCSRLWAHISSSSLCACVAGPIHWYDQTQAGGIFSFPWAAEGPWISEYLLPLCPLILSFAPLLLIFSFSPLLPTLWACLPSRMMEYSWCHCVHCCSVQYSSHLRTVFSFLALFFPICSSQRPLWKQAGFALAPVSLLT